MLRALPSVAHLHDSGKISEVHALGNFDSVLFRICGCGTLRGVILERFALFLRVPVW